MKKIRATRQEPNEQRWGLGSRSESLDAETRLIDAAIVCYKRAGVAKTIMANIANEAKVTRRTVYNYFNSTDEILYAVIRRESDKFWERMNNDLNGIEDLGDYLVEFLIYTLRHSRDTDTYGFVFSPDILPIVNKLYIGTPEFILDLVEKVRPRYERLQRGGNAEQTPNLLMLCEWFVRIIVSYLATPSTFFKSEMELRNLFKFMLPSVISKPLHSGKAVVQSKTADIKLQARSKRGSKAS